MKTRRFLVEIAVDEEQWKEKDTNYPHIYSTPDQLINYIMTHFEYEADTNMAKDGIKEWGYSIKVIGEVKQWNKK